MKRIIFGGSFNPIHAGHIFTAIYLNKFIGFDRVHIVPCFDHPHGKDLIDFKHRYMMCLLAFEGIVESEIKIEDIEERIHKNTGRSNYTIDTVGYIKWWHYLDELSLLLGSDTYNDLKEGKWEHSEELLNEVDIFVMDRGELTGGGGPAITPEISSTEIRRSLAGDKILAKEYLPKNVYEYILENELYEVKS